MTSKLRPVKKTFSNKPLFFRAKNAERGFEKLGVGRRGGEKRHNGELFSVGKLYTHENALIGWAG